MKNTKVGTKMLISLGITLVLTLLMIGIAVSTIIRTSSGYNDILNNQATVTDAVLQSEMEVNSVARQLRDMALFGYNESTIGEINTSISDISDTLKIISSNKSDLAAQYVQQVQDWESIFGEVSDALQTQDSAKVNDLIQNQCTPKLNLAVATGQSLIDQLEETSNQLTDALNGQIIRDIVILAIIVVISIIVGLAFNLYTVRSIVLPCAKLRTLWWPSAMATCPMRWITSPKMKSAASVMLSAPLSRSSTAPLRISCPSPSVWQAEISPVL